MKDRPILFSAPMIRALLDGSKTQTRRVIKSRYANCHVEVTDGVAEIVNTAEPESRSVFQCPYGQPGDHLWVRETFAKIIGQSGGWIETDYRATYNHGDRLGDTLGIKKRWTPAIHMPRDACRITLEVSGVRVERLQDISRGDAMAEGCPFPNMAQGDDPRKWYADLWEQINGSGGWNANPWVWVVSFKKVEAT